MTLRFTQEGWSDNSSTEPTQHETIRLIGYVDYAKGSTSTIWLTNSKNERMRDVTLTGFMGTLRLLHQAHKERHVSLTLNLPPAAAGECLHFTYTIGETSLSSRADELPLKESSVHHQKNFLEPPPFHFFGLKK